MSGSTTDAMARAVEEANIVCVCFSQKYKESKNCKKGNDGNAENPKIFTTQWKW